MKGIKRLFRTGEATNIAKDSFKNKPKYKKYLHLLNLYLTIKSSLFENPVFCPYKV